MNKKNIEKWDNLVDIMVEEMIYSFSDREFNEIEAVAFLHDRFAQENFRDTDLDDERKYYQALSEEEQTKAIDEAIEQYNFYATH